MSQKKKKDFRKNINIRNRKASFEYSFLDKFTAGLVLKGTEIKSLRQGKASFQDTFAYFREDGTLWIKQLHISPYFNATHFNHDTTRERQLLLTKKELKKLKGKTQEMGTTIVPTRIFITNKGWAKIDIALAKGKKLHDKRDSIKERDTKRELDRMKF